MNPQGNPSPAQDAPLDPYFALQAKLGLTKHPGGADSTDTICEICAVGPGTEVLEIGCGAGLSARYLVRKTGCRLTGIDLAKEMVAWSERRIAAAGLSARASFRQADALELPFEDGSFDLVLSESVTAFTGDKAGAIAEYLRVLRPGGHLALNEMTWLQPPNEKIQTYVRKNVGGIEPEPATAWEALLKAAGLELIHHEAHRLTSRQKWSETRLFRAGDYPGILWRFLKLYFTRPRYRSIIHQMAGQALRMPRHTMRYFGYGLYIGRKPA